MMMTAVLLLLHSYFDKNNVGPTSFSVRAYLYYSRIEYIVW